VVEKVDGKKQFREFYSPSAKQPVIVDVPEFAFVAVDGAGTPNEGTGFQDAIGALYGVAYTLKFMGKKRPEAALPAFSVMPLEALWWGEGDDGLVVPPPDHWQWTAMIALPDFVDEKHVALALDEVRRKGRGSDAVDRLRLTRWAEGPAVQIMHVGPYAEERPTIERMFAFAAEQGYRLRGRHHEIYLGDPRRTAPEKLRTVLRHPVERKD
jgi:hypothetical protein